MIRNAWLLAVGAALLIAGLIAVSLYVAGRPTTLRVAVPTGDGENMRLVQAVAQQFARDRTSIRLRTVVVDGPAQSGVELDAGHVDLAVVRADIGLPKDGLAVAVLRQNLLVMMVPAPGSVAAGAKPKGKKPAGKAVAKIDDLAGKRVGVVGRTEFNAEALNVVLHQYDVPADKVTVVRLDPDNVAASLAKTPVDVLVTVAPLANRMVTEAIAAASAGDKRPTLLPVTAAEAIASRHPAYEATEIKEGALGGAKALPEDDVATIGFKHYMLARRSLSEGVIAEFTRQLFSVRQNLAKDVPTIARVEKPDTDKDAVVQAHPGAAAYLDDEQKTFFDRYSDLLYWGLMLMSFLGSGLAWLLSYARADDRIRRMRVIEHLLGIVKAARTAETLADVDRLRDDVDTILTRTLHQVERNEIDESALMAFSLALDQAQLAINDRRASLTARAAEATEPAAALAPLRLALKAAEQGSG